jgi:hypothetical protein
MKRTFSHAFLKNGASLALILLAMTLTAFGCKPLTKKANENINGDALSNIAVVNTGGSQSHDGGTQDGTTTTPQPRSTTEQELARIASAFAERYGSYSNQTNYENLEALLVFMTSSFSQSTQTFIAQEREKSRDTTIYYGITARAVSVGTRSLDESAGTASFAVSTFRKETIGSSSNAKTFREECVVDFRKDGGAWKVHAVEWQGRR